MPAPSPRSRTRLPTIVALGSATHFAAKQAIEFLGIKGERLHRMACGGLPVPPGFIVTTAARGKSPTTLAAVMDAALVALERRSGLRFGDPRRPLSLILRISALPGGSASTPALRDVAADVRSRAEARDRLIQQLRQLLDAAGHPLAIIVQTMVHGDPRRAYTRDPETGENRIVLIDGSKAPPGLSEIRRKLERCFGDMQEFEFAVESGSLLLLSSRTPSRTSRAAVRVAADLVRRRLITPEDALLRLDPVGVERLLHAGFAPGAAATPIATGAGAAPGAAVGRLAFTGDEAASRARRGERIILVRTETQPADIPAMKVCAGVLTSSGGLTSHAAVVARGWGICCVVGAGDMHVDSRRRRATIARREFGENDVLSIDGVSGAIYAGALPIVPPRLDRDLRELLAHADRFRFLRVLANVDTPRDARTARRLGAEGVGLCRTEHMFFDENRLGHMRAMILADEDAARRVALSRLLPLQRADFIGLFVAMRGTPVTIRLLDPPLHEFLPTHEAEARTLAKSLGVPVSRVRQRLSQLREINPMLGHRGARLAITCPEVLEMQVRAILEAACHCRRRRIDVHPAIMVPLIGTHGELEFCKRLVDATAAKVMRERSVRVPYRFGTMVEVPRAALVADELAKVSDFFSFGTNDLTQLTFGYSRDDAAAFLPVYLDRGILPDDPFRRLDPRGVGGLIKLAVRLGRDARPDLACGLCGEHGGDAASVAFCHDVGIDYVSCSPFRVPVARLAAAQAALRRSLNRK